VTPLSTLADLSGRTALVTGAAGHIGLAVCEALLESGAAVILQDVRADALARRVAVLRQQFGDGVAGQVCDLASEAETRQRVREALQPRGTLSVLVHCAAFTAAREVAGWAAPIGEQSVEAWDAAMRVNLTSALVLAQESRAALEASGHGAIVLVSSIHGMVAPDFSLYRETAMTSPAAYGASKAGLLQLMRHLASEFAPRIRVNAISPGGVWRDQPDAFVRRYVERTPLGRMAAEEDIKGAVAYLASDLSRYVTGHNLVIDGGWTAW
jgi:NAD(P)-dependent dehydrogenase (short-subunit alcohol dehydrogenase family)